jgi:hypothetical protein
VSSRLVPKLVRVTLRQSVRLGVEPFSVTTSFFLQLNPCGHSPYVTSFMTRGWVCFLWISFAFVKCKYRTYSMLMTSFLKHYIQVLCQPKLCRADHTIVLVLCYNDVFKVMLPTVSGPACLWCQVPTLGRRPDSWGFVHVGCHMTRGLFFRSQMLGGCRQHCRICRQWSLGAILLNEF